MVKKSDKPLSTGAFKVTDSRGYLYMPLQAQQDLGLDLSKDEIEYISSPNVVLLFKKKLSVDIVLKSLDVLKSEIELRKETQKVS